MKFPGLDAVATAVMILDSESIVRYLNPSAENFFNSSVKRLMGQPISNAFINPKIINEVICLASKNKCSYKALDSTENILSSNRQQAWAAEFSSTATPSDLAGSNGFLLEFNILNRQLQQLQRDEQLFAQNQSNHELLRNLAHEIKNPLGGLKGAAQLLQTETNNKVSKKYTEIIITEAERLQTLLDRLLVPTGMADKSYFTVHEVIRHVADLILAESSNEITIQEKFDVSLPEIRADKEQIIQAILNILKNAVQALKNKGQIILETRVTRQATILKKLYPLAVEINIYDNGPGVPEEIQGKIFSPLISRREGGNGLGLFIAQKLINENNGKIEVTSKPGDTCFSIFLPLTQEV